jgi:hypothetical protein
MRERIDTEAVEEQAVIHTARRSASGRLTVEVRVCGAVRIDGKEYDFNRVVNLALKRTHKAKAGAS